MAEELAQGNTDAEVTSETTTDTKETSESTETEDKQTEEKATEEKPAEEAPQIDVSAFVLPEGFAGLDQEAMAEFLPFAKELKLTQEQAQQVVTLHAKALQSAMKKIGEQQAAASEAGVAEVKAMFGANYEQNMGKIQHILNEYGGEEAVQQQIYGNKALMNTLLKIAEAAGPGRFIAGKQGATARDADILFDKKGD